MANARLFCEQATLLDAFATFGDGFSNLLLQVGEELLDAHEAIHDTRRAVADLDQTVLLWWNAAWPVPGLVLVGKQHCEIGFDLRGRGLLG